MPAIIPFVNERDLLQRLLNGDITPQDFYDAANSIIEHGGNILRQTRDMMNYIDNSPIGRASAQAQQAIRNAAERFVTPDQGYIELVNEHARNQQTSMIADSARYVTPQRARRPRDQEISPPNEPSSSRRRIEPPESNSQDTETMQSEQQQDEPMVAARAFNTSTNTTTTSNNLATPVINQPTTFPWHNVTTGLLEHYGMFSANFLYKNQNPDNNVIKIRMNTYKNPYADSTALVVQSDNTQPANGLSYVHVGKYLTKGITGADSITNTHRHLSANELGIQNIADAMPSRVDMYHAIYGAYTVKKCHWEILVDYPVRILNSTTGAASDGTIQYNRITEHSPPCESVALFAAQYKVTGDSIYDESINDQVDSKEIETRLKSAYERVEHIRPGERQIIKGTWYPGKVRHHALNDSDIDVWTATGQLPTSSHLEHLVINLKNSMYSNDSVYWRACVNVYINLKYEVQFRELNENVLYPNSTSTFSSIHTFPDDLYQVAPAL